MGKIGKLVANFDEWTLNDTGFAVAADTPRFVRNLCQWFTGGKPGKFHAYSTNFGLTGSRCARP